MLGVIDDFQGDTDRMVYTLRLPGAVYVLHAFQRKAKRGIATPGHDLELIWTRPGHAEQLDAQRRDQEP